MATHFNTLAWEVPWTEGPGVLQSMGSQKTQTTTTNISIRYDDKSQKGFGTHIITYLPVVRTF